MNDEQRLEASVGELARITLSASDEYMRILRDLGRRESFASARQRAHAMAVALSTTTISLCVISPKIGELPANLRPPLGVVLLLGALQASCTLIATASDPAKLEDMPLAGAREIDLLADGGPIEAWVRRALAVKTPDAA